MTLCPISSLAFLAGRSTILQLLIAVDKWTETLERGGMVDVVYCDFRKAFDTVPHKRLLELLKHYGFQDPVRLWVKDFFKSEAGSCGK